MMRSLQPPLLLCGLFCMHDGIAQQEMQDEPRWGGSAEFGFLSTSGNSNTETINFSFDYGKDGHSWRHSLHLEGFNSASEEQRTAERYLGYWQSNLKIDEGHSLFFRLQYEEDKFGNYSSQWTLTSGYGNRIINTDKNILDLELGPGFRRSQLAKSGDYEDEAVVRLAGNYKWTISEYSAFGQLLSVEEGTDNTIIRSNTSLTAGINSFFSLSLSYEIRWTRDVEPEKTNYDRETRVGVLFSW